MLDVARQLSNDIEYDREFLFIFVICLFLSLRDFHPSVGFNHKTTQSCKENALISNSFV